MDDFPFFVHLRIPFDVVSRRPGKPVVVALDERSRKVLLHWMVVGYISPAAKKAIEEVGGRVEMLEHKPLFIAVGIAYDPAEHKTGLEFWNGGEIQESSTGIHLQWGPRSAGYYSVEETYLILPGEEYDAPRRQVKEPEAAPAPVVKSSASRGDDFDPFLDFDEDLP